ncbi:MAG: hypothetical protein UY76_C0042G0007 [Candidatus Uhrbacteria bacterium GW2011_GWA2_52_8d]|uniref:Uncharacterized protein n=1 Tax=Candidatus Uhrbacteria bacterium GW2011_GWA2_52_8d TaxID=1618979 RepID=A0A0G1XML5_9BACT|nr:MAG: hypothetical protein UY76_C0042G0007 [Candidatus Uhrbacteria bacterium GW2011_GWA2_52_8d]
MPEVKIHWNTEEQELKRVLNYLKEIEFYKQNNYQLSLPEDLGDDFQEEKIKRQVFVEYSPKKFETKLGGLQLNWKHMEKVFFEDAQTVLQIKPLPEYECFITQYGTGGSYNPPNVIIANIKSRFLGAYNIGHELIHLLIHDLIEKNNIDHWQKERLVDHYLFKILHVNRYQNIPESIDTKIVDEIFESYSSQGVERVIRELNKKTLTQK